jgi:hypothetical protein
VEPAGSPALDTRRRFTALVTEITGWIGTRPLDEALQQALNAQYPAGGETFRLVQATCLAAIDEGWMCEREGGGIRFGRVHRPSPALSDFSVDVVDMTDVVGPNHIHPKGEIDLVMPVEARATFDGHGAGWLVYGPESEHPPTVTGGRSLVLYLLPDGAIQFT